MDVRLLIATWPADAPRGAVSRFCREHDLSRSRFYELRAHAQGAPDVGRAVARRSRAPRRQARATPLEVEDLAVRLRKQLADDGWDCGPLSVRHELLRLGVQAPSRATLARLFLRRGLVTPSPAKRPRSSWKRFTFAAPNACWQLDGTEWTLLEGTRVVILQVLDDHSRRVLASLVADAETSQAACAVVRTALDRFGVPQLFLTDNGIAFNPVRRGTTGQLAALLQALGTRTITSRPHHPQTCGKNERVHATLKQYLRAQPRAAGMVELQAQVDAFDAYYNGVRPHQELQHRTPVQAWDDTPTAAPPTPAGPDRDPAPASPRRLQITTPRVAANGRISVAGRGIQLGWEHRTHTVLALRDADHVDVFTTDGTHLRSVTFEPDRRYYPSGRPRGGGLARRRAAGTQAMQRSLTTPTQPSGM